MEEGSPLFGCGIRDTCRRLRVWTKEDVDERRALENRARQIFNQLRYLWRLREVDSEGAGGIDTAGGKLRLLLLLAVLPESVVEDLLLLEGWNATSHILDFRRCEAIYVVLDAV
jgi:hypothetical protein